MSKELETMIAKAAFAVATLVVAAASLVVSVFALGISWDSAKVARQSYERSSGRILPSFRVNCETSHVSIVGGAPTDPETVWVRISNEGTEPIEAIRLEVLMDIAWGSDRGYSQTIAPTRETHELSEILQPNKSVVVHVLPLIVKHAKAIKLPPGVDQSYWLPCTVSFSAKIAGGSYFASTVKDDDYRPNFCSFGVTLKPTANSKSGPINFGVNLGPPEKVRAAPSR